MAWRGFSRRSACCRGRRSLSAFAACLLVRGCGRYGWQRSGLPG
jgi:hypothetical protein